MCKSKVNTLPNLFILMHYAVKIGLVIIKIDAKTDWKDGNAKRYRTLGRRQVVRHRLLVPTFVGSNPAAPATVQKSSEMAIFSFYINNLAWFENLYQNMHKSESSSN